MTQAQGSHSPIGYKPDIDGLRAIAVLLVIAFHFFPKILSGGFIGVDVFFVISGYLITKIIHTELAVGHFSFVRFYANRVRRIFPSLLTVLLATYGLGWLLLHDTEFRRLSKHLFASVLFVNNFLLRNEKGYFDSASEAKPLLHFWSLSIEEQFYLAWPLVLWLIFRWLKKPQPALVMLCFASFAINIYWVQKDLITAFYLPVSRAWELLFGGLLAIAPRQLIQSKLPKKASTIGLLSLGLMAMMFHENMKYPGFWALGVVSASALIICGAADHSTKILTHPLSVWLGRLSYPLYLWHWPLLSFGFIAFPLGIPVDFKIALLIASLVLAWATKKYVEDPVRFKMNHRISIYGLAFCMLAVGCIAVLTYHERGIPTRSIHARNIGLGTGDAGSKKGLYESCPNLQISNECKKEPGKKIGYVLIGDSKAASLLPGLIQTNTSSSGWMFIGGNAKDGAPIPLISDSSALQKYATNYQSVLRQVELMEDVNWLVMAVSTRGLFQLSRDDSLSELLGYQDYQGVLERFSRGIEQATKLKKPILLVIDNPTFPAPEKCASRDTGIKTIDDAMAKYRPNCQMSLDTYYEQSLLYRKLLLDTQKLYPNHVIEIYDSVPDLCNMTNSTCNMHKDGRYLYGTTDHISEFAANLVGSRINNYLKNQKAPRPN
jgi:peptidoglycan/LPS O-acetylase OafA/YrhL